MAIEAENLGFEFPYLFDADQEVAKSYQAACTPDFFLFNKIKSYSTGGSMMARDQETILMLLAKISLMPLIEC